MGYQNWILESAHGDQISSILWIAPCIDIYKVEGYGFIVL